MSAYYNEFDPFAAAWLRNLIAEKLIPAGDVDERSIVEVQPRDLAGYTQCHFFAGIGGWALAARLAGWPDDRELWTGSCPCQPFSNSGQRKGHADERHLWPEFLRLIRARWPAVVMGEQVAAAIGLNWLDGVLADLEDIGYAGRAVVLPACAVDAPHRRDRLWFVADGYGVVDNHSRQRGPARDTGSESRQKRHARIFDNYGCEDGRDEPVGDTLGELEHIRVVRSGAQGGSAIASTRPLGHQHPTGGSTGRAFRSFWRDHQWLVGPDGKARRVKPGVRLLADGFSSRVGLLRAFGNAIVPQEAAEIIGAWMDCTP